MFRKVGERTVYRGPIITLAVGTFAADDGTEFDRDIVHHPGAVSVVPVIDGEAVLVRQYRAALDRDVLEIPAGKRDVEGEDPATTARRELAEEVGLAAQRMELLAEFYNSPGFSDEHSYVYLARDVHEVASSPQGHEEEAMTIVRVLIADAPALIAAGDIVDAKTIIGLLLARERL